MTSYEKARIKTKPRQSAAIEPESKVARPPSGSNQAVLSMMGLNENAGIKSNLEEKMQQRLEQHFGYNLSSLEVRESNEAGRLGGKALTKGNIVHFQPGILNGRDSESEKIIAHEISHAVSQAANKQTFSSGYDVMHDPLSESAADRSAASFMSQGYAASAAPSAALPTLGTASANTPAEGWGIGIFRKKKGEHETLTESARKKASAAQKNLTADDWAANPLSEAPAHMGQLDSEKAKKSLQYGARFNDLGHRSLPGMIVQMEMAKKDAFVNQTHKGDLQFMHSMDTSGGDTKANVEKMQRYAQFSSDVYQNREMPGQDGKRMQDMNMLDYVLSQNAEGDPFQEMMMSTMIDPAALKKFDAEFGKADTAEKRKQRTAGLKQLLTPFSDMDATTAATEAENAYNKKSWLSKKLTKGNKGDYIKKAVEDAKTAKPNNFSNYAKGTIGDFFTGGNKELDAGMVALGSASHMLEDSFAGSHAIRADNLHLKEASGAPSANASDDFVSRDTALSETGEEIVNKSTPIMGNADYTKQSSAVIGGRHGKADKLKSPWFTGLKGDAKIDNKIEKTRGGSLARDTAAQYMLMNVRMKQAGESQGMDSAEYAGSQLDTFVKGITKADDNAVNRGVTATGRAYDKKFGFVDRIKERKPARLGIKEYRNLTGKNITKNEHTTAKDRAKQLPLEVNAMEKIMASGSEKAQSVHRPHAQEMLANLESMLAQLDAAGKTGSEEAVTLQVQKERLLNILKLKA